MIFPLDLKLEPKFFFFDESQRWGVVLDRLAEHGKIQNENNVAGSRVRIVVLGSNKIPETRIAFVENGRTYTPWKALKRHKKSRPNW